MTAPTASTPLLRDGGRVMCVTRLRAARAAIADATAEPPAVVRAACTEILVLARAPATRHLVGPEEAEEARSLLVLLLRDRGA